MNFDWLLNVFCLVFVHSPYLLSKLVCWLKLKPSNGCLLFYVGNIFHFIE